MGTLVDVLDQPFPAGRAWAEEALHRLGLRPDSDVPVRHVAQGWMRLGAGADALLVDTLFVLTDTHLGFGQLQVETTDPQWVPLSSIVAIDLIEGVPYPLDAIEVQFAGGLAIFVGWPESLSTAVIDALRPATSAPAVEEQADSTDEPATRFAPEAPAPPAPPAPLFDPSVGPGADDDGPTGEASDRTAEPVVMFPFSPDDSIAGVGAARPEVADDFFADLEQSDGAASLFSVSAPDLPEGLPGGFDAAPAVSGPWDDPTISWPDPLRSCVFLGGHPVHQRRRKNVLVVMRPGGLVITAGGHGWSVHVGWHEVRRLDIQGADEVKFTHNHRIDLNGSALVVELTDGSSLLVEVRGKRPATLRSGLAPIIAIAAAPAAPKLS